MLIEEKDYGEYCIQCLKSPNFNTGHVLIEFRGGQEEFKLWYKAVKRAYKLSEEVFKQDVPIFVRTPAKTLKIAVQTKDLQNWCLTAFDEKEYKGIFHD